MDTVTYPEKTVIEAVETHVVPLRLPHDQKPISVEFAVSWTPAHFILDVDGRRHVNNVGFLPPEEFVPWIILGRARTHFDRDEFDQAMTLFGSLRADYPESQAAPEALYFMAVGRFKIDHDAGHLKKVYDRLNDRYSDSIWTKKSIPYREQ